MSPRIVTLDIETHPATALVFDATPKYISHKNILEPPGVLCLGYKTHGEDTVCFARRGVSDLAEVAYRVFETADVVVTYNGDEFDLPRLNELVHVRYGHPPPAVIQVDLLKVVRKKFGLMHNGLDAVCKHFGLAGKTESPTLQDWVGCMEDNPDAWDKMRGYNQGDVLATERLFDFLRPWIDNVNHNFFSDTDGCPGCGGRNLSKQGFAYTSVSAFQRWLCRDCGRWSQSGKGEEALKSELR